MLVYVQALINIVFGKLGPEDLPDSSFLLAVTLIAYVFLQIPAGFISNGSAAEILTLVAVSLAMAFVFVWVLLRLMGLSGRYRQTLTALLGTAALLSALAIPFVIWRMSMLQVQDTANFPELILFLIMLWSIAVDAHIFSRALSRPFVIGLLVSVSYFFLFRTFLAEMMPPAAAQPMG